MMLQRLYVNNFRCLENFELKLADMSSVLLIGKNGSGKSTVASVLEILQQIGRDVSRVGHLITPEDMKQDVPVRFEFEVLLGAERFDYMLALELPEKFRELRVLDEQLAINGEVVFSRKVAQVNLRPAASDAAAPFMVDWHMIAFPIIQPRHFADAISRFKTWMAQMVILAPIPALMRADSTGDGTLLPVRNGSNFSEWFSGFLAGYPAGYVAIDQYLRQIMPDFDQIKNTPIGTNAKSVVVQFAAGTNKLEISFDRLSDGEKCFFLCALVLAANKHYGPIFCFWDEPDNYLALPEVGQFVATLRQAVENRGQFLMTSHNAEAIKAFSDSSTLLLTRNSHLEPTVVRLLDEIHYQGDVVDAMLMGGLPS
jgi:ABC-type cobalamin/Fe3+-siderophores transport system ATPase subunit